MRSHVLHVLTRVERRDACEQTSDAELVHACRQNDEAAWAVLVSRYRRLVYGIAVHAGLDEHASAEVFQRVFARLVENLDGIEQPHRLRAWLVTTARRESGRVRRREQREPSAQSTPDMYDHAVSTLPDDAMLPDVIVIDLERRHLVRTSVAALDERCRHLLELLFYRADVPAYADVAAALGTPEGSVGPTRARCLDKLRRMLDTAGYGAT